MTPRLTEPALRLTQALREEFSTLHGLHDALRAQGLPLRAAVLADETSQARRGPALK